MTGGAINWGTRVSAERVRMHASHLRVRRVVATRVFEEPLHHGGAAACVTDKAWRETLLLVTCFAAAGWLLLSRLSRPEDVMCNV